MGAKAFKNATISINSNAFRFQKLQWNRVPVEFDDTNNKDSGKERVATGTEHCEMTITGMYDASDPIPALSPDTDYSCTMTTDGTEVIWTGTIRVLDRNLDAEVKSGGTYTIKIKSQGNYTTTLF